MLGPEMIAEPRLLLLAPELVQTITEQLDTVDIFNLRLTCKDLGALLRPQIFRTLSINVTKDGLPVCLDKLRALATPNFPSCYGTRKLVIGSLSPYFDPVYRGPTWRYLHGEWVADPDPQDAPEVALAEEEITSLLFGLISSLRGVRTVEWSPNKKDGRIAQTTVMKALQVLPSLHSLHISIGFCKIPISFDAFSGLQAISITGTSEDYHEEIFDSLARMVARTPELASIDIASNWRYRGGINKSQSLHEIFKYYPSDAPPLSLRHLGLQVCLVRLDEITMPHLRHLTSLNLSHIEDPYKRSRYTIEEDGDGSILQEQKRYGSTLEDIWKTFQQAEVRLEQITLDVVDQAFLRYLSSYSGLEKLHLTPGGFSEGSLSDAMAEEFFTKAISNHVQTLEELDINAIYEGGWCFGSHNLFTVASCHRLRKLRMSVVDGKVPSDVYNIKLFLDTALISMPRLETLHIFPSNSELLRDAFCGNPAMAHFAQVTRTMLAAVEKYSAPSSCTRVPNLFVGCGKSFIPIYSAVENTEKRTVRYVDTTPGKKQDHDLWRYQSLVSF